jgi:hypothetical protein
VPGRPHLNRAIAPTLLLALLLSGCSGGGSDEPPAPAPDTDLGSPGLSGTEQQACDALLASLPATLAGKERRTDVGSGPGAIWGDPPLVLRCGVGSPDGFDPAEVPDPKNPPPCTVVNGVGWFVPVSAARGGVTAIFTAVGYRPRVSLTVLPADQPEGGAAALAALATSVKQHLQRTPSVTPPPGQRVDPCA